MNYDTECASTLWTTDKIKTVPNQAALKSTYAQTTDNSSNRSDEGKSPTVQHTHSVIATTVGNGNDVRTHC